VGRSPACRLSDLFRASCPQKERGAARSASPRPFEKNGATRDLALRRGRLVRLIVVVLILAASLFADMCTPSPRVFAMLEQVRAARSEVVVEGVRLVLRGAVYRDFMPMVGDVDRVHAVAQIAPKPMGGQRRPGEALPFIVRIDRMWIVDDKGAIAWAPLSLTTDTPSSLLPEAIAHGSPDLGHGDASKSSCGSASARAAIFCARQ
jgi:hypothetical protein